MNEKRLSNAGLLRHWLNGCVLFIVRIFNHLLTIPKRMGMPNSSLIEPSPQVTSKVLKHIRNVIRSMEVLSWVDSVPGNFDDLAAGTLKAMEWRILATIYLPIALVILWGEGTLYETPEEADYMCQVLDHTMSLVSAVILVCYRSMSTTRASAYLNYVTGYIRDLDTIHKDAKHHPNHHMAVHIYEFLQLFGPVRSWWTFPFECLIGHIQRLPTNNHFGELEGTLMHTFICACNLK
jgi:hypothetical protein